MAFFRVAVLFAILIAHAAAGPSNTAWKAQKAAEAAAKESTAKDDAKGAAVNKVVQLLESLAAKVTKEGLAEAKSYQKYCRFTDDVKTDKAAAIKKSTSTIATLEASILELGRDIGAADNAIGQAQTLVKNTEADNVLATTGNTAGIKAYTANAADLSKANRGMENALKTLKSSTPSLLQMESVTDAVQEALIMADALGLGPDTSKGPGAALLQNAGPKATVEMENYKNHNGGVITTLEALLGTFRTNKNKADMDEVQRVQVYNMRAQANSDKIAAENVKIKDAQKDKDTATADQAKKNQDRTTEKASKKADEEYLGDITAASAKKKTTFEQRHKVRSDELAALTSATTIIKGTVSKSVSKSMIRFAQQGVSIRFAEAAAHDDDAMEAQEAEAEEVESGATNFLQRGSISRHVNEDAVDKVSQLLARVGGSVKSAMLISLASDVKGAAPKGLEKVKTLVSELISRLQAEQANEATQQGWCQKSLTTARTKQENLKQTIDEVNGELTDNEVDSKLLAESLTDLAKEIAEANSVQKATDATRAADKKQNAETVVEATAGLNALNQAVNVLSAFYNKAAKEKDTKDAGQSKKVAAATAANDADAGFKGGDAYSGSQAASGGILAMLDVIKSDFTRTIKMTQKAEVDGKQDYDAFTDGSNTVIKEQTAIQKTKTLEKSNTDSKIGSLGRDLKKQTDSLVTIIQELIELQKSCIDTGMSYKERKERRAQETQALRKALCILDPTGAGCEDL